MSMDDSGRSLDEQHGIAEQERRRCYYERLSDWSEPDVVKINRNGKLVEPPVVPDRVELRKRIFKPLWNRARP